MKTKEQTKSTNGWLVCIAITFTTHKSKSQKTQICIAKERKEYVIAVTISCFLRTYQYLEYLHIYESDTTHGCNSMGFYSQQPTQIWYKIQT